MIIQTGKYSWINSSVSCRIEVSSSKISSISRYRNYVAGTPINRLPVMAKHVLDLYELFNKVVEKGGLVEVINKKQWQEIIREMRLPSSITSAAFTLRTQYTRYLVRKRKHHLSFMI